MKKRAFVSVAMVLSVLLVAGQAFAGWQVNNGANFKVNLPDNWSTTTRGEVLVTRPVLPGLSMEFVGITSGGGESFLVERSLMAAVGRSLTNAHITVAPRRVTQYGMPGVLFEGTGTAANGVPVNFISFALSTGPTTGVLGIAFAAPGQFGAHRNAVVSIFNSVSRAH